MTKYLIGSALQKCSFAVFDIDGTLIRWQLFHAVVHSLGKRGLMLPAAHKRIKQARMQWKVRTDPDGFTLYENVLVKEYIGALQTIGPEQYEEVVQEVFDEYKDQTFTYTRDLVKVLKAEGYFLIAISGSQQDVVERLAKHHGFDVAIGSVLEQLDGEFTGRINTPIFDKAKVLRRLMAEHNLTASGSYGVGDTSSDAVLLELVEHPIAFNPDKKLFAAAQEHGWKIVVERKNVVYELEQSAGKYSLAR